MSDTAKSVPGSEAKSPFLQWFDNLPSETVPQWVLKMSVEGGEMIWDAAVAYERERCLGIINIPAPGQLTVRVQPVIVLEAIIARIRSGE